MGSARRRCSTSTSRTASGTCGSAASASSFRAEWCTTADIFRRDAEGYYYYYYYYYYEGRADDLLKVSGIWVSPLEIENALLEHPALGEVCIVGKEDEGGLVKPLAFVVANDDAVPGAGLEADLKADLKAFLKERLTPYKYPRWFEWREHLPKNDQGKVARKVLKAEIGD
ncbi:MAG: hypothetical protein GY711_07845 [bacterium]|nr:hypothetical protein [bacterium]